mmetsp:Transcript_19642/g.18977  ORF Transcript_19642/g.18977 Transcript_19642/m.18977 type:complete len:200 (-) Transcript_19642:72-671(-)
MSKRKSDNGTADEKQKKKNISPLTSNILDAIRSLKNPVGSSASAILKVLINMNQYDKDRSKQLNKVLKTLVDNCLLIQLKQSFLVKDDPLYEDLSEKIEILTETISNNGLFAKKGDNVVISYKGRLESGIQFDASKAFPFQCGGGDVVKGMDASVLDMKIGGKRTVRIPASLGYGKRGSAPEIPPNAVLIFDIVLLEIN